MWFKNISVFQLVDDINMDSLEQAIKTLEFTPCGSHDAVKVGFVPPIGKNFPLIHAALEFVLVALKRQEKILPPGAIKEKVAEKVAEIEENENRGVGKKERQSIKDEIIFSMLPTALKKSEIDYGYIDTKQKLLIINTSSSKRAEDFCSKLREALGSLRCVPMQSRSAPTAIMTAIVDSQQLPPNFELGENLELDGNENSRVVVFKKHDLDSDQVKVCLASGMYAAKLSLTYNKSIHFEIDANLVMRGVKYDSNIQDKAYEKDAESKAELFDAEFSVMAIETKAFINDLLEMFGGLVPIDHEGTEE